MLSKITLNNVGRAFRTRLMLLSMFSLLGGILQAQTTITTNYDATSANATVTFNIKNNRDIPVVITDLGSVLNLDPGDAADVSAYFKTTAINGAPGAISAANGWTSFGSATVVSNGLFTPQPFLTGTTLTIPAGATYGIAVNAFPAGTTDPGALGYNNPGVDPSGTNTITSECISFLTGPNIGFAGGGVPSAPTGTVRRFTGTITFTSLAACSGTPNPGNTLSSVSNVCSGVNFDLSLQNCVSNAGLSFVWQQSAALAGPYTDIPGAISSTLTTSQTASTYYQAKVTCAGVTATSTPVLVSATTPTTLCYCAAGALATSFEKIANVTFGTLNNSSVSDAGYENFVTLPTASFVAGSANAISITGNAFTYFADQVFVWIDYNQNGSFADAGELVYTSPVSAGPWTGTILIPATATPGITGMRVRMHDISDNPNATSCGNSNWGQVEDYRINITPCVQGSLTTQPVNRSISCGAGTSFSVAATGTLVSYQWQQRTSATAAWTNVANAGVFSGANTNTLTISSAPVSMNGYQYRAAYTGSCTPADFSNIVTLTVAAYQAPISPAPAVKCSNSNLQIFASPPPTVTTVTSPNLAIPILNGNTSGAVNGINHTLAVAGIPAGAIISDISIKLNITHTYVADLMIVVKAPNGNVLNLSNLIGGTNGAGENFVNTVFSSNATTALVSGVSPGFTGSFKPDAAGPVAAFNAAGGPAGFLPTFAAGVGTLNDLTSVPSGNWTIAMYDAGPPDEGVLNNWSISITWGVTPATGVFSPTTNLFLDAAATIPYTGTAVNSVYTNTPTSTTYSAIVSNGTCTSGATSIPVTVTAPLTTVTIPATTRVCVGNTVTIPAVSAAGTAGTINYIWQVSTDNGVTYNTISNTGVYSGATTPTLTITGATTALTNNRYRAIASIPSCGSSVTTAASVLTVNVNPTVTISSTPNPVALYPGQTATLTATVTPNAAAAGGFTWYKDGLIVPGATSSTLPIDVDGIGVYTVRVNDVNACNSTSASFTVNDAPNTLLFIYPNPNAGQFQVRYYSLEGNSGLPRMLNVYDSKGSRVFSKSYLIDLPYTRMEVDMSTLGAGVYSVELTDSNGKRLKTGRVLVQ